MEPVTVDWPALRWAAVTASRRAYVPYSKFPVGVAALTSAGRVITGCNVENAAYGVALCAECGLISTLIGTSETSGRGAGEAPVFDASVDRERLVALSCVDGNGTPITPCGRCRQLLHEHAMPATSESPGLLVEMADGEPLPLAALLPHAFGAPNLGAVATSAENLKGAS